MVKKKIHEPAFRHRWPFQFVALYEANMEFVVDGMTKENVNSIQDNRTRLSQLNAQGHKGWEL